MSSITRRQFLTSTAASAAMLAASRAHGANERVGVGVIGCRNRGHQDAASFLATSQADIVTLCDCDSAMIDSALRQLGGKLPRAPRTERDFRRVLDDPDVDAVIIATPDHWHGLMTALALEAGKHVYIEKPSSYNIGDGRLMLRAQEKHPKLAVQVGTQQRSGQHFQDAKQFIAEGGLGTVGFARAWITHVRETLPPKPDSPAPGSLDYEMWVGPAPMHPYNDQRVHYNWHWVRDWGTGEMGNWGAHWLDVVRWFLDLGLPQAVSAHGGTFVTRDVKEWPDSQTVLYEFPGVTVLWEQRLWTKQRMNDRSSGVEIGGDKGTMIIDRGGWIVYPTEGETAKHSRTELEVAHAANFLDAITSGATLNAPLREGDASATMCHLGNIATVLGRRVTLDPESGAIQDDPDAAAWESRTYRGDWERDRKRFA